MGGDKDCNSQLTFLMDNRKYVRGKATRLCNKVNSAYANYDSVKCDQIIEDLKDRLGKMDQEISSELWKFERDRERLDAELESCDTYAEKITASIRLVKNHSNSLISTMHSIDSVPERGNGNSIMPLPSLPKLPTNTVAILSTCLQKRA